MKKVVLMLCLLTGIFGVSLDSHAALVTFEALSHNDDQIAEHGATYAESGFLFTNTATVESSGFDPSFATAGAQLDGMYTGSTALFNDNWEGQTILTRVGGGTFNLNSIDLAELYPADVQFDVAFTGLLANGSTVSKTFTLDGALGAQSFSFGSDFSNLASVSWSQSADFHQFDNVNATPTPIPAAAWLLGSGIMGLAGIRRRTGK
jgi:hypothetical protein